MRRSTPVFMIFSIIWLLFLACNSTYTSKKKGYFAISFPEPCYQLFDKPGFPYKFEYPTYASIVRDSTYFDNGEENDYWVNIDFPDFNARIFLSYKAVGGRAVYKVKQMDGSYRDSSGINSFDKMVNDAFTLTSKNEVVASSIRDSVFTTTQNISGVFFRVGGNAATSKQFFVTDTTKNFLRGALYFNATPNADSLQPVQDFLQQDINHLLQTFTWK